MLRCSQKGITLIEMMIVVVIVSILAGIAYPSYQMQVRKSRRAAAQAFLMDVGTRQQQRLVDVRSYTSNLAALNLTLPADLTSFYTIAIVSPDPASPDPRSFAATMTAIGSQAADAGCTPLTLNHASSKGPPTCW